MPNKESARKRVRQAAKARIKNRAARSAMRAAVKKVRVAVAPVAHGVNEELKNVDAHLVEAQKKLGKAAKTNLIKKNTAARLQSRLMRAANKAKAAAKG